MVVGDIAQNVQTVIIGAGPAGYVAAIRAAQLGLEVVLIERGEVGGICLHAGCISSKALIQAANAIGTLAQATEMGVELERHAFNMQKHQAWKASIQQKLTRGISALLAANGVTVVKGTALFMSEDRIAVETEQGMEYYRFEAGIIATGSRPQPLPNLPFDGLHILSSTEALRLTELPKRLLIIGGDCIGLELGTAFAKLGTEVIIACSESDILQGFDHSLVQIVKKNMRRAGITLLTQAEVCGHTIEGGTVCVTLQQGGAEKKVAADKVLVTVGRRPNTEGLDLDRVGLSTDEHGFLTTDHQGRTANRNLFAIGDVTHGPLLAHRASREGMIAAEAIAGRNSAKDMACMPTVLFTDPEIATVGLTEAEARAQGIAVTVGQFPFAASGRALTLGRGAGFCRIIAEQESRVVLGVHIVGAEASSLVGEAALAIEMGATLEDISLTLHPHPTLTETLMEAAADAQGIAIHVAKRR